MATEFGLDLNRHRSRRVSYDLLQGVDWVIAMTRGQLAAFKQRFSDYHGKIGLLGAPGKNLADALPGDAMPEVTDPYLGQPEDYRAMAHQVDRLVTAWGRVFSGDGGRQGRER
jgi:protein-tyrosine-phosphatase